MNHRHTPSKNVLAVLGMLCVSRSFREAFFAEPQTCAQRITGPLSPDEIAQIRNLAGHGVLPHHRSRDEYQEELADACDEVYEACACPEAPCPCSFVEGV
ncbi:MAG TPA: hypothetical protein VN716_02975 [Vicinamibacterales bacterium]|jgi:hypothetical protein|nr:hypothetical protein [Vicinamibacterales bacterium]